MFVCSFGWNLDLFLMLCWVTELAKRTSIFSSPFLRSEDTSKEEVSPLSITGCFFFLPAFLNGSSCVCRRSWPTVRPFSRPSLIGLSNSKLWDCWVWTLIASWLRKATITAAKTAAKNKRCWPATQEWVSAEEKGWGEQKIARSRSSNITTTHRIAPRALFCFWWSTDDLDQILELNRAGCEGMPSRGISSNCWVYFFETSIESFSPQAPMGTRKL